MPILISPDNTHSEPRNKQEVVPVTPPELLRNDGLPKEHTICQLEQGYNLHRVISNVHVNVQLSVASFNMLC